MGPLLFSLYINDLPTVCSEAEIQMYADDTVIYVHATTKQQAACKLTTAMAHVKHWLNNSCLHLNTKKTVCMLFTKRSSDSPTPDVYVAGEKITVVSDFKYLGVTIDSNLTFKKQIKTVTNVIKFNLSNFRHIRNCLTTNAATLYFNAMIMSHLSYCLTSWAQAPCTTLKSVQSAYHQAIKVLDKKPNSYHHCNCLRNHKLLSWDNLVKFTDACLVYKILHNLAPPPLSAFIKQKTTDDSRTRSAARRDCIIPRRRSAFGQSAFSVRASHTWNRLPTSVRHDDTYHSFKTELKSWLKDNQVCDHIL